MTSNLSPAGSSVYSSDTMYVGDGTWDSQRNTFLLPNLQGFNLATTQYNGMGNRFRNMAGYNSIIMGHGIVAAITFLFILPAAIFMARFYHKNPRMALRVHIWLQIMVVLLSTVVFILGFQAVGSKRSLTNPHHGIGVALYTMILVQAFAGCIIHRREKGKERFKVPLKLMLHQWVGRAIAILGVIQVALGITLYGSPKWMFIAFAIWAFLLLVLYFILSYRNQPDMGFDDRGTYITERTGTTRTSRTSRSRSHRGRGHGGLGALAAAGAAGAGLAALRRRSSSRRRHGGGRPEVLSSRHSSHQSDSYISDAKHTTHGRNQSTWKEKLLGIGAAGGGILALRSIFNRKRHTTTESGSEVSYSRPPLGPSEITQTDLSRLEEGRAPASPANNDWRRVEEREAAQAAALAGSPLRPARRPSRSGMSIDSSSFDSATNVTDHHDMRHNESHGLRNGVAALGVAGFLKHQWNKRRNRREDAHVETMKQHDIEEERLARANSNRRKFTADGSRPPPRRTTGRPPSTIFSESDVSRITPAVTRPPPRSETNLTSNVETNIAGPSTAPGHGVLSDSDSEAFVSAGGNRHRQKRTGTGGLAAAAAAGGAATGSPSKRDHSRQRSSREGSIASPPVSVKVKMHNDGRHVTLRRLNEEEAAAEREARKRERQRRNGSVSSLSNTDKDRWRRTEALEMAQAQAAAQESQHTIRPAPIPMPEGMVKPAMPGQLPGPPPGPPPGQVYGNLPPPPPIPGSSINPAGSGMSSPPGTGVYGTETDVSNYDSNRRRRRAERAQAKQARQGGGRVEFS